MRRFAIYRAFLNFVTFAPRRIIWVNFLSLVQSGIGSLGFLLLIPLMQLAGLDVTSYISQHGGLVSSLVEFLNRQAWTKNLETILLGYVVLTVSIALLTYHRSRVAMKVQQSYVRSMRSSLYKSLLESDWAFLSSRRTADYLHRVGAQVQGMNVSANQLIGVMHLLLSMIIYTSLLFLVHWQFTLATIGVGLLVGLILVPVRWSVRDVGVKQLKGYQEIFATLAEHLSNLKMIKASAREAQFHGALEVISTDLEEQQVRMQRAGALIGLANSVALALGFAVLLYLGIQYYGVLLAEFVVLMMIMSRILPQLASLQQAALNIANSLPAFVDIEEIFQHTIEANEIQAQLDIEPLGFKQRIDLVNVGFHYTNSNNAPIFEDLNLSINAYETVALRGASGIGKTTIADLISSLVKPTAGQLLIDGVALDAQSVLRWRRGMAYVTQDVYLFNNSIRYNLTWPTPNATDDEIWAALKLAAMDDMVRCLPDQLETRLGDRGVRFSGGERQRLAIARALLSKPNLLILDEATSALDNDNERKIQDVIKRLSGQLTVLIIAHRESTIAVAERVIDVSDFRADALTKGR